MYAIVETGGKQYQVEEGRYVDVELLGGTVHIDWAGNSANPEQDVYMTGPANYVFEAELNENIFSNYASASILAE